MAIHCRCSCLVRIKPDILLATPHLKHYMTITENTKDVTSQDQFFKFTFFDGKDSNDTIQAKYPNTKHSSTPWKMKMAHPPNHHQRQGVRWHPHKIYWCPSQPLTHTPPCWTPMHETKIRHHHQIPHATLMLNKQCTNNHQPPPNFACHNMCTPIGSRRSAHHTHSLFAFIINNQNPQETPTYMKSRVPKGPSSLFLWLNLCA